MRLQRGESVLNTALAYAWKPPQSFMRAFRRFHGMTPFQAKTVETLHYVATAHPTAVDRRSIMRYSIRLEGPHRNHWQGAALRLRQRVQGNPPSFGLNTRQRGCMRYVPAAWAYASTTPHLGRPLPTAGEIVPEGFESRRLRLGLLCVPRVPAGSAVAPEPADFHRLAAHIPSMDTGTENEHRVLRRGRPNLRGIPLMNYGAGEG